MTEQLPQSFAELRLSQPVLAALEALGYKAPTDVQGGVIPLALAGIDLIVQSQTGTGKTAAFAIPIAELLDNRPGTIQALVLAPTRELAMQVAQEARRVGCEARGLDVVAVYGGASIRDQIDALETAQVVVATPGRMLDLLRRGNAKLDDLKMFILDEADEMLSMGFEKELTAIREFLPEERQNLMFSATVSEEIRSVAAATLFYPEFVTFSSDSLGAEEVTHQYFLISGIGRLRDLLRVIHMDEPEAAIIFCNTKDDSFQVANFLKGQGFNADVLNGDLPQNERQIVMGRMKSGDLRFLVATDIAARGIDISFLPCVINYVLPESAESYVHRTGRTGRAGRSGVAVSLISPKEIGMFYQLRRAYKFELQRRDMVDDETLLALRERRALDRILAGLDAEEDLAYGQYLSFADSFPNLPDHRQRLAKLIAYFTAEEARKAAARAAAAPAKSRAEAKVEVATDAEPVTSRDAESAEVDAEEREPSPAYEAEEREPAGEREARGDDDRDGDDEGRDRGGRGRRRRGRGRGRDRDREGGAAEREPSEGEEREERGDREEAPRAETRPATADEAPRASGEPERKRRRSRNRGEGGAAMTGESEAISANGAPTSATGPSMTRIRINLGRDRIDPEGLLALVAELSGMDESDLGAADLRRDHAWLEVRDDLADDIIAAIVNERVDDHVLHATR